MSYKSLYVIKNKFQQLASIIPGLFHCFVRCCWFRLFDSRNNIKTEGDIKRVLIVKLDAIGDFILWLDVAKELRKVYPPNEYKITLLGNRLWTDLAKSLPYFDEVMEIDRPNFFTQPSYYHKLLERFSSVQLDVVLHPVYSREFLFGDLFVLASDAKKKIGMQGDGFNLSWWQKRFGNLFYTDLIPELDEHVGELEHNAQFLRWLALTDFKARVPNLKGLFKKASFHLPAKYYLVIPGASVNLRMWPTSKFIALIDRIYALTGMTAVVCGGQTEEGLGRTLEKGKSIPFVNLIGQTSLSELVSVISEAHFVVGNETGGVHIAVALGVPVVCIVGGGHFGRFIPYSSEIITPSQLPVPVFQRMECFGCNWKCIHRISSGEAAPCIESISLELVLCAVNALVGSQNKT